MRNENNENVSKRKWQWHVAKSVISIWQRKCGEKNINRNGASIKEMAMKKRNQ